MSMNIMIRAVRVVSFKTKSGSKKRDTQTIDFNAWQTPTGVTKTIFGSLNPAQAYIDWVLQNNVAETVPVYDDTDLFRQGNPIGVEIFNHGKDHVDEFKEWLAFADQNGYTIRFNIG